MTRRQLERIVRQWLPRLGLERWDISFCWGEWDQGENSNAYVWRSRDYDRAKLYFNPAEHPQWEELQAHRIVVHELLHLVTREAEHVVDLLDGKLAGDVQETIKQAHSHALEGIVDRLAYRLVDLAGLPEASSGRR